MIGLAITLFICAAMFIAGGIVMILKPAIGWYSQQWRFKEDIPEPSDTYLSVRKFLGVFLICAGVLFLAGGILNCL
ncbi:DUF6199 family natural product biosynthesis protein [Paenibacillus pinistramenti]|uniref:DUF6199 family natural product biosynthesis protein n=1 Tax=Paenibacillus pinistramenti TaxID=1768003 RepID=UPI0011082948|nr:DUF6199 family natural product biosynthesis protein [Paenibacillus pinistramenti]